MESSTKIVKVPLTNVVDNNTDEGKYLINELNRISLEMNDLFYYILNIYLLYKLENNEEIPRFSHQLIITVSQICKI